MMYRYRFPVECHENATVEECVGGKLGYDMATAPCVPSGTSGFTLNVLDSTPANAEGWSTALVEVGLPYALDGEFVLHLGAVRL